MSSSSPPNRRSATPPSGNLLDDVRLLDLHAVADLVGRSPCTVEQWIREGNFPRPLQMTPGTKRQWTTGTIRDHITKRARSHYVKKTPRGLLKHSKRAAR
jgi:predicted DNA-binding transcriptional regulator AlpA